MVSDQQVRKLMKLIQSEETLALAAAKAGMDEKTARKYRRLGKLPSQCQQAHTWKTRVDPFADHWPEIQELLQFNPGLEAKTIFADLQRRYPGRFQDGQLRTLQRKVKKWRVLEGPPSASRKYFSPRSIARGSYASLISLI
jgi:predicted site-specific integrase-resolvase